MTNRRPDLLDCLLTVALVSAIILISARMASHPQKLLENAAHKQAQLVEELAIALMAVAEKTGLTYDQIIQTAKLCKGDQ